MKDGLYKQVEVESGSFTFDSSVVEVFQDMIKRSVPGYGLTLEMIGVIAQRAFNTPKKRPVPPSQIAYDLGCSLGASMYPILEQTQAHVIGVDLSADMLKNAEENLKEKFSGRYALRQQDLREFQFQEKASLIISNFTLQFLPLEERTPLLKKCYDALEEGGILLISEKFQEESAADNALMIDLHHTFKGAMGYSDLEIARKRDAIENVLIPEKKETHIERLREAGFKNPVCWYQCFNFGSFLAVKG